MLEQDAILIMNKLSLTSQNLYGTMPFFEVLSPSTEAIDRGRKFNDYQKCLTLQEYILVNAHEPLVEVFKREKDPMWMYRAYRGNAEISLFSLGLRLRIEDIYQGVKF